MNHVGFQLNNLMSAGCLKALALQKLSNFDLSPVIFQVLIRLIEGICITKHFTHVGYAGRVPAVD